MSICRVKYDEQNYRNENRGGESMVLTLKQTEEESEFSYHRHGRFLDAARSNN